MIEYNWWVYRLDVKPTDGVNSNVVSFVYWTASASNESHRAYKNGKLELTPPTTNFIEYPDITSELVIGWVQDKLGVEYVQNTEIELSNKLDLLALIDANQSNIDPSQPLVSLKLPWLP